MPTVLTHLGFVGSLKHKNTKLFKSLDLNYVNSGALFPDYYGFYKIQLNEKFAFFSEIRDEKGIVFGKRMYSLAKTKEEKSFAIGFITHTVLDKYFHKYFKMQGITTIEDHLMLEFFYDCKFKNQKIKPIIYTKGIIEKTLNKYYPNLNCKNTGINNIKILGYYLFLKEIQIKIIHDKYLSNRKSHIDVLASSFYRDAALLRKLITPNLQLKKKHLKNLETEFKKAKIEMNKILEKLN